MSSDTQASHGGAAAGQIFDDQLKSLHRRTSRMFAWLMLAQWIGGIVAALVISPYTWIGAQNRVHQHVWIAVLLGGALAGLPMFLAYRFPAARATRHVIAVAQMLFSALLIHLTGGRVETHFHIFGSLAFLAFYRDWQVLLTATVVVALDHMIRGIFVPISVFGTFIPSNWRWVEHAAWVLFEDIVLFLSCFRGVQEMRQIAERQAAVEEARNAIEVQVLERTRQLVTANTSLEANQSALSKSNQQLRESALEREQLHERLVVASREAGMAEVAIGVLHNVGNVLNSVNVAAGVVSKTLRASEVSGLVKAGDMLREHENDLPQFLQTDDRGRHLPAFLIGVSRCLEDEHKSMAQELEAITRGVEHVKHVISMQQSHAKAPSLVELVRPAELMDAACKMQQGSLDRYDISVDRRFEPIAPAILDKHRVLQILVNLISNAKGATRELGSSRGQVTLAVRDQPGADPRQICFAVSDNGVGIAPENLQKLFSHGFTTRADGHGFGLHSAATAAQAMRGSLTAHSDGLGKGATFLLVLPTADTAGTNETDSTTPETRATRTGEAAAAHPGEDTCTGS